MDFLKKEDGSICIVRLLLFMAFVAGLCTAAGFIVGKFLEKD